MNRATARRESRRAGHGHVRDRTHEIIGHRVGLHRTFRDSARIEEWKLPIRGIKQLPS